MTSKLTREERVQALYDLKVGQVLSQADIENVKMLSRMALAAMDSEPVAEVCEDYAIRYISSGPAPKEGLHPGDKLYRHEQQPVVQCVPLGDSPYDVPHSMPSNLRELIAEEIGILFSDDDAQSVWDVCRRAAMLAAAPQEVKGE